MAKFLCNKLGRDKGLEGFRNQNIKVEYKILKDADWQKALKLKLTEETLEVCEAENIHEVTEELADVIEVLKGLCKAYGIDYNRIEETRVKKYNERGGFEEGLYIETLEMEESNPRTDHFRKSPDKYPEV